MPVTDNGAESGKSTQGSEDSTSRRRRRPVVSMRQVREGQALVRNKVAAVIWFVAVLCAAVLAIGALLVALEANPDNVVYQWFSDSAQTLSGPVDNLFRFQDEAKTTLVNWGIAAVAYLVVGKVIGRVIKA